MASSSTAQEDDKLEKWIQFDEQKNTLVIKPIALDVAWGRDDRYWIIPKTPEDPLELRRVVWLEVTCTFPVQHLLEKLDPQQKCDKQYKVNFTMSMMPESAFGWGSCPVFLKVKVTGKKPIWRRVDLSTLEKTKRRAADNKEEIPPEATPLTFTISKDDAGAAKLSLGLYEIWKGGWKGGLAIHQVTIKPID